MSDSEHQIATRVFDQIEAKRRRPWRGEEEVRIAYVSALESELEMVFDAERAKKDSSYNNVIIEFKAPGLFHGSKSSYKFKEATDKRLLPYIRKEAKRTKIPEEDFIGIAVDGEHICFAQIKGGKLFTEHLLEFSPHSVKLIIAAIRSNLRRAITIDNLLADFGHGSKNAVSLMKALSDGLADEISTTSNSKIKMLYEEWKSLYGQVSDMSKLQSDQIEVEMSFDWKGLDQDSMSGRLFVIHTYNSLLIKLIAAEIVSAHGLSAIKQPAQGMASQTNDKKLIEALSESIENSQIFTQAGINGFVEEVIFSWYIDLTKDTKHGKTLISAIRNLLVSVSLYRTDRLNHTRDVLRDLYQGLVPGRLRQSLGEFYTPDWLVDLTISKVKKGSWLNKRILDPTCGSGAFLVSVIREKIKAASKESMSAKEVIELLCGTIWGFDLNPLAVQTARVNFLMEIAFFLKLCPGTEIEIPVLLADAIYSPAPNPNDGEEIVQYQIGSTVAGLDILLPSQLAFDRNRLDAIFNQMGEDVELDLEYSSSEGALIGAGLLSSKEAIDWTGPLEYTYNQILSLHRKNWNGIWFRIVRNFFWSATAGRFDFIVGNPPWVRWSKLPDDYRARVKPTCEQYDIFSENKRHGGNELDISAMITYTTADKWLLQNGRIGFVLTGSLFKNPSSAGFRKFRIRDGEYLSPKCIEDLGDLKPFPDASNHTTVVLFDKSKRKGRYPVPYNLWKASKGNSRNIPPHIELADVKKRVTISNFEAAPVGDIGSPWAVLSKGRFDILKSLSGTSEYYIGRKGITADLNGVYFVPILKHNEELVQISSRPDAGKKDIGVIKKAWVEPTLLYPLVKGAGDFEACYMKIDASGNHERLFTFLPNNGISTSQYKNSEHGMNRANLAKTKNWFKSYKKLLESRSTYRRQMKGAPYYAVYNVGDYTFKPWKVIWPEMSSKFYAAVASEANVPIVGNRPYIPDHKIYYCAFDNKAEAYFLCGLLNADFVKEWIESHNVSIQVGNIFKHLELPYYNSSEAEHRKMAKLVEKAHNEDDHVARASIVNSISSQGDTILKKWMSKRKS